MKKLFFAAAFFVSLFTIKQADAQISISLNLNIDSQPTWGPTGYDHVEYYYLPDIDCYYYVPGKQFVYQSGSRWIWASSLPPQYSNYDLYGGYKVVVNQPKPYLQNTVYRTKYASYKGRHNQPVIRDSHDAKYKRPANKNRPVSKPSPTHGGNEHKPAPAASQHRLATSNKPAPSKDKKDDHHSDAKKDDHEHH